jgi:hypothetical protein
MNARAHVTKLAVLLSLGLIPAALAAPTQSRDLKGYSKIHLRGSLDLEIEEGSQYAFTLEAPERQQDVYRTEVKGDTLEISVKSGFHMNLGEARARITLPELDGLQIDGSGDAKIRSLSHVHDVEIEIHGSGDVDLSGSAAKLAVSIQGSGDVTLQGGSAQALDVRTSGSGDVDAKRYSAKVVNAHTSGSGDVSVTVDGGPADFSTNGSGDIDWWGKADQVQSHSSGSGDVTHH